jgi:hypothetical protein
VAALADLPWQLRRLTKVSADVVYCNDTEFAEATKNRNASRRAGLPGGHSLATSELHVLMATSIEQAEDARELRKLGSPTKLSSTNRCNRVIHVL